MLRASGACTKCERQAACDLPCGALLRSRENSVCCTLSLSTTQPQPSLDTNVKIHEKDSTKGLKDRKDPNTAEGAITVDNSPCLLGVLDCQEDVEECSDDFRKHNPLAALATRQKLARTAGLLVIAFPSTDGLLRTHKVHLAVRWPSGEMIQDLRSHRAFPYPLLLLDPQKVPQNVSCALAYRIAPWLHGRYCQAAIYMSHRPALDCS